MFLLVYSKISKNKTTTKTTTRSNQVCCCCEPLGFRCWLTLPLPAFSHRGNRCSLSCHCDTADGISVGNKLVIFMGCRRPHFKRNGPKVCTELDTWLSEHSPAGHICFVRLAISLIRKNPIFMSSARSGKHSSWLTACGTCSPSCRGAREPAYL